MNDQVGCIFDLDGTLVDSLADIADALNRALRDVGVRAVEASDVRRWIGDGLPALCRRAAPHLDPAGQARLVARAEARCSERCVVRTQPYPNILETLRLLKAAGVCLAVLSNKPHALALACLTQLGITSEFDVVRGFVDESQRKPSPRAALEIARKLGVPTGRMYLVGDSPVDVETARAARMASVAVTWGYGDRAELDAAGPDFIVDRPDEIVPILVPGPFRGATG